MDRQTGKQMIDDRNAGEKKDDFSEKKYIPQQSCASIATVQNLLNILMCKVHAMNTPGDGDVPQYSKDS